MPSLKKALVPFVLAVASSGCGAELVAHELDRGTAETSNGVIVNRRTRYKVDVKCTDETLKIEAAKSQIILVCPDKVVSLNICRWPFSDGKLNLQLNDSGIPNQLGVTTGNNESNFLNAANAIVDARNQIADKKSSK